MPDSGSKGAGGYLTVYVSLSMAVLLSLCLTLIGGVRMGAARMETECIMDIGLNSILAEYHRELMYNYNLFFVDTSYGTPFPSSEKTAAHLQEYMELNAEADHVFLADFWYRDLLRLKVQRVNVTQASFASDGSGSVLRKRAIEAVRDDVGLTFLEEISDWLKEVESNKLLEWDGAQQKNQVDSQIQSYDGTEKQLSEKEWVTVEVNNPTTRLDETRSTGILNLVLDNAGDLSRMAVDTSRLISRRAEREEINRGNMLTGDNGAGFTDRLLFQEYLMRYLANYGKPLDRDSLQYQLEYLIAGKESDVENLKSVVYRISALREAANAVYLFGDEAKCAEADALSSVLAAAMLIPEIQPLLKTSLLLGWAYAESLYDVKCLLAGERIPLIKDNASWHYGIGCIFGGAQEDVAKGSGKGQNYEDYLRILMAFTDLDTITLRVMDMMEDDIRQKPGNEYFRMDACADMFEASAEIESGYGGAYSITRSKGY